MHTTLTGTYTLLANPCSTKPCLPGLAYAVVADNAYFPTLHGNLLVATHSWGAFTPQPGDKVAITGIVQYKNDAFGKPFRIIEVEKVKPATEPAPNTTQTLAASSVQKPG